MLSIVERTLTISILVYLSQNRPPLRRAWPGDRRRGATPDVLCHRAKVPAHAAQRRSGRTTDRTGRRTGRRPRPFSRPGRSHQPPTRVQVARRSAAPRSTRRRSPGRGRWNGRAYGEEHGRGGAWEGRRVSTLDVIPRCQPGSEAGCSSPPRSGARRATRPSSRRPPRRRRQRARAST
jgi:hypothetical protein